MYHKIRTFLSNGHRMRITLLLCFLVIYISAQNALQPTPLQQEPEKKRIELRQANDLIKRPNFDPMVLLYDVILYHEGAYMYCDSAYWDQGNNSFEAFDNVMVEQGDTLFMYGDYLFYDGNTQLLKVRNNVRLENKTVTLFTDSLNYDRILNLGYYFEGGLLVDVNEETDEVNELTSYWGQYEPDSRLATFSDSVKLVNPKFILYSDTLLYDTETKIADILGPSTIVSDSAIVYTSRGWYNTQTEESVLLDQSLIVNPEGNRTLIGDSIYYNKIEGYGEVFGNMFLQDTLQKVILRGHYGFFNELTEFAYATDSAFAIDYSQPDSLFLHADTLRLVPDSIYRQLQAYYGVRFYRTDIQGVCDSMQYNTRDSILYLYKEPVLWNENQQLSGDTIEIHMNDSTIEMVHMKQYCFAIEQLDSIHFNQLKGRDLKAYFDNGEIRYILVEGNAESIFYPEEKGGGFIGMNQTESPFLSINLKDKKIEKLKIWPDPSGTLTPLPDLSPEQTKLPDFQWFDYLRPTDKDDIFRKVSKKQEAVRPNRSNRFNEAERERLRPVIDTILDTVIPEEIPDELPAQEEVEAIIEEETEVIEETDEQN